MTFPEYSSFDALALGEMVRNGQTSAEELLETAIQRLEAVNPGLNAVIHKLYDAGRLNAKRVDKSAPFAGVPLLVKDLGVEVDGAPMNNGCKGYKNYVSTRDLHVVKKMRAAGFVIFGKTNVPEFGLTPYTEPLLHGPTRNPWNDEFTPGGSSGGSAAAVAAGIVPIATANDGGGSIRIPASCCGLFGLKPSRGRTTWSPLIGEMWNGATVEGCLSRSVRDTAAYLDAIIGNVPGDPYYIQRPERPFLEEMTRPAGKLRIAFSDKHTFGLPVDSVCKQALQQMVEQLTDMGHEVHEVQLPYEREDLMKGFTVIVAGECAAEISTLRRYLGRRIQLDEIEPLTYSLGLLGRTFTAQDYAKANRRWNELTQRVAQFHEQYDLILTPTLAHRPPRVGSLQNTPAERRILEVINRFKFGRVLWAALEPLSHRIFDFVPWTPFANATGQPSMSIPVLKTTEEALPIGVMFTARYGEEGLLFRLAAELERAAGGFDASALRYMENTKRLA